MLKFDIQEKVDHFIAKSKKAFSLEDVAESLNIKDRDSLHDYLAAANLLINNEQNLFCRGEVFFNGKYFLISPQAFEIENNILFPGDRFSAFCNSEVFPSECKMFFHDKCFTAKKLFTGPLEELAAFHTLLGAENIIEYFVADSEKNENLFNNPGSDMAVELNVFDFKDFYKKHKFKPGDVLKVKIKDYNRGIFDFSVIKKYSRDQQRMKTFLAEFESSMLKIIDVFTNYLDISSQIAYAFFLNGTLMDDPQLSSTEIIELSETLGIVIEDSFSYIGRKEERILDDDPEVPDNMFASLGPVNSLEAILEDIKYPISITEIDAFILDFNYRGIDDFDAFFRHCFEQQKLKFMDDTQECAFLNFVEDRWEILSKNYNAENDLHKAPLRQQVLELCEQKIRFLSELDDSAAISGDSFEELAQISCRLVTLLEMLNAPEHEIPESEYEPLADGIEVIGQEQQKIIAALSARLK